MKKLKNILEDIFILSGCAVLILAAFMTHILAGMYATGFILLSIGVYFAIKPRR